MNMNVTNLCFINVGKLNVKFRPHKKFIANGAFLIFFLFSKRMEGQHYVLNYYTINSM